MESLIRAGFVARALTYGLIGVLTLALALGAGTSGKAPNQQGALALVASAPLGAVAVILIAAGLLAYAGWKLLLAVRGRGPEGGGDPEPTSRIANLAAALSYLALFAIAVQVLGGSSRGESKTPSHAAAGVLGWPGGPWLVGLAGAVLIGVSAYQVWSAIRGEFTQESKTGEMSPEQRRTFRLVGRIGLTARSLVFVLIGYFLLDTALTFDPAKAVGVDGALGRLHHEPLGPWLTGLVALGLIIFAAFSLFEARYRRL